MNLVLSRQRITQLIAIFRNEIEFEASMGRTDLNKASETILIPLLNEIYGWNLVNVNYTENNNSYPGIDLADKAAKVCLQVTATTRPDKVKHTLKHFVKYKQYLEYDRLIVFFLKERQSYTNKTIQTFQNIIQGKVSFDSERDLWDWHNLLKEIDNFQIKQVNRIREILEANIGIEQELLSLELLRELSTKSLELQQKKLGSNPATWIPRQVDALLSNSLFRDVTFLVASSGFGKSVACVRKLKAHISSGGFGLILSHETVASVNMLEQAVLSELSRLHPSLATLSSKPFSFCSPEKPLLLIVEDVNQSSQIQLLLNKIASWSNTFSSSDEKDVSINWRILCPLWPEQLAALPTQTRERVQPMVCVAGRFTETEGREAVLVKGQLNNQNLSLLDADLIAHALGNDPLLIALHKQGKAPDANNVIESFFEDCVNEVKKPGYFAASYRKAIRDLGREMISHRKVECTLNEVIEWEQLQDQSLKLLSDLVDQGKFIQSIGSSDNQKLVFRHDRVRDWVLADATAYLESQGILEEQILTDPYFAEIMGVVLAKEGTDESFLQKIASSNPLALFHALRTIDQGRETQCIKILQAIDDWLDKPGTHEESNRSLRWKALAMLSETDSSEVPAIIRKFQERTIYSSPALLRNGDIYGGIEICIKIGPDVEAPWRDSQIEHAIFHHRAYLVANLSDILKKENFDTLQRIGALRLAGHLGEPSLALAIETCWINDGERNHYLNEYLWAFAMCCADDPVRFLEPVCDAWSELPEQYEPTSRRTFSSTRTDLVLFGLDQAFHQFPPYDALDYFIRRGAQDTLRQPVFYLLHAVDEPKAVLFVVQELARLIQKEEILDTQEVTNFWRRAQESGRPMSAASRNLLLKLWQNKTNDKYLRTQAFSIWAATKYPDDLKVLRSVRPTEEFAENIFAERLIRGDQEAIPEMLERLEDDDNGRWWQYGRFIWSTDLTNALDKCLEKRGNKAQSFWDKSFKSSRDEWRNMAYQAEITAVPYLWTNAQKIKHIQSDWILHELIMRLSMDEAEKLLIKHWNHLCFSPYFVQTALYVATSRTLELANSSISQCPEPAKIMERLSSRFGIQVINHPGVTREAQIQGLAPYCHLLSQIDIGSLWRICNLHGWFATRREVLDDFLQSAYLDQEQARSSLDKMVEREDLGDKEIWINNWVENYLKTGANWNEVFSLLTAWVDERKSFEILEVFAGPIKQRGSRADLEKLRTYTDASDSKLKQIIEDTEFVVKCRSLH